MIASPVTPNGGRAQLPDPLIARIERPAPDAAKDEQAVAALPVNFSMQTLVDANGLSAADAVAVNASRPLAEHANDDSAMEPLPVNALP